MEEFYQVDRNDVGHVKTDVDNVFYPVARTVIFERSAAQAVAASTAGILAAVTDNGSPRTGLAPTAQPPCPRNVSATAGGTAGDIKAISVTVRGKRNGVAIEETLPAFTVNTAGTVQGSKIFDEIDPDGIDIPAHDGTGATTSVGWGDKLGLDMKLSRGTLVLSTLGGVREATLGTLAISATNLESNYLLLSSALSGAAVAAYIMVP